MAIRVTNRNKLCSDVIPRVRVKPYYRAKYYDPSAGRFVSEDVMGNDEVPNLYAYVENNPIDGFDPLGQYTLVVDKSRGIHRRCLPLRA